MRHRRVWLFLAAGVITLLVLRYTNLHKESDETLQERLSKFGVDGRHKMRSDSFWWKQRKKWEMPVFFHNQRSASKNLKKTEFPEVKDCSFAQKESHPDLNSNELWDKITTENQEYMTDNYWLRLKYNQSSAMEEDKLKVFVMPHSHTDPGWLKTFAQYTVDTNNALTYMLEYLPSHPAMTFTWNEVAFFEKWWRTLNQAQKETVKKLIKNGQLELTSGSWTMTDEASPYFWASIDNIVEGHQFLVKEVGEVPKVEWSNDPFGYGPTVPYLFRKSGIKRLALNRIHKQVKMYLERQKSAVFEWRQFWDEDGKNDVLTHTLPFMHYDIPNSCGPDPGVCCQFDFKRLTHFWCPGPKPVPITDQTVAEQAGLLYDQYRKTASLFRHNVILILLGDDFRYTEKDEWAQQHDNYIPLFEYMNSKSEWNIEARFGTFSQYFQALKQRASGKDRPFPVVSGDFFPYNDFMDHYWTGYFTTRPFWKRLDRLVQGHIRAADILSAFAFTEAGDRMSGGVKRTMLEKLTEARRDLALFQHHDAITGTSKWPVVTDYGMRLFAALLNAADVVCASAQVLLTPDELRVPVGKHLSDSLRFALNVLPPAYNMSEGHLPLSVNQVGGKTRVILYNSLPYHVVDVVRLQVTSPYVAVAPSAQPDSYLPAQINPVLDYESGIRKDLFEVVFHAELLPLSLTTFVITRMNELPQSTSAAEVFMKPVLSGQLLSNFFPVKPIATEGTIELKNTHFTTKHDVDTGLLEEVEMNDGSRRKMSLNFYQYENTLSGAYLFKPVKPASLWPVNSSTVFVVKGKVVSEIRSYLPRIFHTLAVHNIKSVEGAELHIRNTVDLRNLRTSELIMRIESDVRTENDSFYTDHLGFQLLKRRFHKNQRVETNYYPMASAVVLDNEKERLTVLSGHGHGVTRPSSGTIEIMLDRILSRDDGKGLGMDRLSLIRDNVPSRSEFRILLQSKDTNAQPKKTVTSLYHSLSAYHSLQRMLYPTIIMHNAKLYNTDSELGKEEKETVRHSYAPISNSIPCDCQLLTIRPLPDDQNSRLMLIHRTGIDCSIPKKGQDLCKSSSEDSFEQLLERMKVNSLWETQLSGVLIKNELKDFSKVVDMEPMDIKAYRLTFKNSGNKP